MSGLPIDPAHGVLQPVGVRDVTLTGGFWGDRQRLNATAILTHAEEWIERTGWAGNFDAAAEGRLPRDRRGREFADSEIYKLLEAMSWEVARSGDQDVERRLRALTARVAAAQEPDGYLNTMFGRPGQGARYSDLEWGHELYCFGHLIQAGVARARTAGADDLLVQVARRAADHVCAEFGPDGRDGVCGHPEIETALAELFRLTGERRYLDQARLFLERRGHGRLAPIDFGPAYFQDDQPFRTAGALRGHAVRALYLASGAVDVAVETDDPELLAAAVRQTTRALERRTYLTGGMGSHHEGESFGEDFELPPDRAYSETCAGVASVQLNQRLLLATGEARYADAVERTLYNVVATSPAADGHAFFYVNTLHQREPGRVPEPDRPSPRAASSLRAPWFDVSCCPTNVARTLASLGAYVATTDADGLQLHQYAAGTITTTLPGGAPVSVRVSTVYPADGHVRVTVLEGPPRPWTLRLRVPHWAGSGATVDGQPVPAGYATVTRAFAAGDTVDLELPVRARWTYADPRIDAVRGTAAVERGPLVYCLTGADVSPARVHTHAAPVERDGRVLVPVSMRPAADSPWPYAGDAPRTPDDEPELVPLTAYHAWGNNGPSTMRVWIPVSG
ncbi:glycoside hydrolase family 127 protein [Symbioplanes lichenis]|uniref:glycoside hydrolase family 127 protein n=1 Tax=Symbioplanes lichenis TaxID=1629072 RepID=UPI0027396DF2|nr:beta-L-arabinofuranosidase domain-containing protein [Actinoplanes lichenis]